MLSYVAVLSHMSTHYVLFLILAQNTTCCGAEIGWPHCRPGEDHNCFSQRL